MNDYMIHMIERLEHEERVQSVPCVPEFGYPVVVVQRGWALQWAGRLLHVVGSALAALRKKFQWIHQPISAKHHQRKREHHQN